MQQFFYFIDIIIDSFVSIINYTLDLFTMVARSHSYLLDVFVLLPTYFYVGIAPFLIIFIILMILGRG